MASISSLNQPAVLTRLREHLRTPLFRNAYALVVNQLLSAGLGVLYWMLAARLYQPEVVGRNAALISTMIFVSFVSQLSLKSAMTWFIPRAGHSAGRFVVRAYLVSMAAAGLVSAACVAGARMWGAAGAALGLTPELALWFALSAMIWCVFTIQDGVLTGLRQAVWVPAENAIYNILKLVLLVGLSGALPESGIFLSWSLPVPLLALAINWLIFRRLLPGRSAPANEQPIAARRLASFIAGDYLGALFSEAATRLLPLLVVGLLGAAANAYFYQTWTLAAPLALVVSGMAASLTVEAAADRANGQRYSARMLRQMLRVLVPAALLLALLAPVLLGLFGRSYAAEGVTLLRLLALAALPNTLNIWYISLARVRGRVRGIMLNQLVLCVLAVGLSAALLPRYGITGVGWAWLIAQSVVAGLVALDLLRHRPAPAEPVAAPISRNLLLRQADWRFLLPNPQPARAVCFAEGELARAAAQVAGELLRPAEAAAESCDLAVLANPDRAALAAAWRTLQPGGACYATWPARLRWPGRLRQQALAAGFSEPALYTPWPAAAPRAWLPLAGPRGVYAYLAGQLALRGWLGRLAALLLPPALGLAGRLGLLGPVVLVAQRAPAAADDLQSLLRGGDQAEPAALLLATGGRRVVNKVIGLTFAGAGARPCAIVKLARVPESARAVEREAAVLRELDAAGLARAGERPQLLFSRSYGGLMAAGQSALTGTPLVALVSHERYRELALRATDWLCDLAGAPAPTARREWWETLVEGRLTRVAELYGAAIDDASVHRTRLALLDLGDLPLVCAHRDFTPWNVLLADGRLAVFDWESAELRGLPALDLIYFLTNLACTLEGTLNTPRMRATYCTMLDPATLTGAVFAECLQRYAAQLGLQPAELRALRLFVWVMHAELEYECLRADADAPPSHEQLRQSICLMLWQADLAADPDSFARERERELGG